MLGPLQVEGLAPGSQERLLVVLLQRANEWVDADTVVRAIWPDEPPAAAKGNVKAYVHQLRQVLPRALDGSPRINSRSGGYRLNLDRGELDAAVFEDLIRQGQAALQAGNWTTAISRLTQALELWRGDPYGPLGGEVAPQEAARLRSLRDEALDLFQAAGEARSRSPEQPEEPPELDAEQTVIIQRLGPPADVRRPVPDQEIEPWSQWRSEQPGRRRRRRRRAGLLVGALTLVAATATAATVLLLTRDDPVLGTAGPTTTAPETSVPSTAQPTTEPPTQQPGVAPRRAVPGLAPPGTAEPKLLFGVGDRADSARQDALVRDTPTRMLTTRYRGEQDLDELVAWKDTVVRQAYADGFAMHLVITADDEPESVGTAHGAACGRPSVVQASYLQGIEALALAFAGTAQSPPLFVTVFDGVQSYGCDEQRGFRADEQTSAYYSTIKDQYVLVRELFLRSAPNALVSLGWDARLAASDDPDAGGGRSMLGHFEDVLRLSDFTSVSVADNGEDNARDVAAMVESLGKYGPVMLSTYAPEGNLARVVDADVRALFEPARLAELTKVGLFAWSFGPDVLAAGEADTAAFVADAIRRHGRPPV